MERNRKKTELLREVAMGMPPNRRFLINQVCDRLDCAEDTIEKLTQDNAGLQKELHETKSELQRVIDRLHEVESERTMEGK